MKTIYHAAFKSFPNKDKWAPVNKALFCFMFRMGNKILTKKTINQNILKTKYAVRGELAIRADEITRVKCVDIRKTLFIP